MPRSHRRSVAAQFCLAASLLLSALAPGLVYASEGGGHSTPAGAITNGSAFMPPPGVTMFTGYFLWFPAESFRDNSGKPIVPEFRADIYAHAGRFLHTWDQSWHGLNFTSSLVYLVDYAKVKIGPTRDEAADLSAFNIQPLIFTAAVDNWHFLLSQSMWYPVGNYHPERPASAAIHQHYVSFTNEFDITWLPVPWVELSAQSTLTNSLRNHRTGYRSGDMVSLDLGLTMRPFATLPQLGVGVGSSYLHQFNDDHLKGQAIAGTHFNAVAIGPQLIYSVGMSAVVLKWQHQTQVHNSARGEMVWLEFGVPLKFSGAGS